MIAFGKIHAFHTKALQVEKGFELTFVSSAGSVYAGLTTMTPAAEIDVFGNENFDGIPTFPKDVPKCSSASCLFIELGSGIFSEFFFL